MTDLNTRLGRPRYINHIEDKSPLLKPFDPSIEIPKHASLLANRYPPEEPENEDAKSEMLHGLFGGPTSIAFTFFVLRDDLPELIEGKSPLDWSKLYLQSAKEWQENADGYKDEKVEDIDSGYCGIMKDKLAWSVVSAAVYEDERQLETLFSVAPNVIEESKGGMNWDGLELNTTDEWCYGRTGYLYLLRFTKHHFPHLASKIDQISKQVIEATISNGPDSKKKWYWIQGYYLGLGHGWIGILTQILLSDPSKERLEQCKPWLLSVLKLQYQSGNWPKYMDISSPRNKDPLALDDILVQIGHGAPGIVCSLVSIRPLYEATGDKEMVDEIGKVIDDAQECIWKRGVLSKESSIMHGAAGNSLGLKDKERQKEFMKYTTQDYIDKGIEEGSLEASSLASGLQTGLAGRLWVMVESTKDRYGICPAYNDY